MPCPRRAGIAREDPLTVSVHGSSGSVRRTKMAQVSFTHMGSGLSMQPGQTLQWSWNKAADERVWGLSVEPYAMWDGTKWGTAMVEITKVYETHKYTPGTAINNPHERKIYVVFKNTGTSPVNYEVYMSTVHA